MQVVTVKNDIADMFDSVVVVVRVTLMMRGMMVMQGVCRTMGW